MWNQEILAVEFCITEKGTEPYRIIALEEVETSHYYIQRPTDRTISIVEYNAFESNPGFLYGDAGHCVGSPIEVSGAYWTANPEFVVPTRSHWSSENPEFLKKNRTHRIWRSTTPEEMKDFLERTGGFTEDSIVYCDTCQIWYEETYMCKHLYWCDSCGFIHNDEDQNYKKCLALYKEQKQ